VIKTDKKTNAKRLLILSCSDKKREGLAKAIELYDGPAYHIVRNYLKQQPNNVDIKILSAKYGLIDSDLVIPTYNQKMTREKALEYAEKYKDIIKDLEQKYDDIFVYGGRYYRMTIKEAIKSNKIKYSEGTIGKQLSQLKNWLYNTKQA